MAALIGMTFLGFTSYSILLPVTPLWVIRGGASSTGSGLVNGILLLSTVITQLFVPSALRRLGWGPLLAVGMVLLGVPGILYATTDALGPVLALSLARGAGFGVLTVTGSAAVANLVSPARRGEAIGAYGLAIAVPQLLLPLGPWIAEHLGFLVNFAVATVSVIAIAPALRLSRIIHHTNGNTGETDGAAPAGRHEATRRGYGHLARPMILLFAVTLAGGGVLTFTPQIVNSALVATGGLFVMQAMAMLTRWRAGGLADRHGPKPFIWPLTVCTIVGMGLLAWAVLDVADTQVWIFFAGMVMVGTAYGALQNLTLVDAFNVVPGGRHNLASAMWNVGFDLGTATGSVLVGAVTDRATSSLGLLAAGAISLVVLPAALARRRDR